MKESETSKKKKKHKATKAHIVAAFDDNQQLYFNDTPDIQTISKISLIIKFIVIAYV